MATSNLKPMIDRLGAVMAAKGELAKEEKAIKKALADLDVGGYAGKEYYLSVGTYDRGDLDKDAVLKKLGEKWVKANTKTTTVRTLRTESMEKKEAA